MARPRSVSIFTLAFIQATLALIVQSHRIPAIAFVTPRAARVTHTLRSQHNTNALRWAQACGKHSKRSRKSNIAFGKGKHGKHKHNNSSLKLVHEPAFIPEQIAAALKPNAVAPGLVHKSYKNRITVNLLDIDTMRAPIHIRPIMASESFGDLKDVSDAAKASRAVAAVNANYFKKDGTPLGTLIVDGEWVSGPLYDRVALGIDNAGLMHIDKVQLGGILETSNTDAPQIWINNVNQPRRNGAHVVAYTRRWGCNVRMDYPGCLVALNAQGEVVGKDTRTSYIPIGGIVLTDSKDSAIAKLKVGDLTHLTWQTRPDSWQDVSQAVSGGPLLIKDDKVFLDLKAEKFHPSWTGNQIKARTACGVTADNHLLLITVEGSHTLWDLAKLLHCLGAVDAMNLDGGGSTTMVVNNVAVTRGAKSHERRVASAIGIFLDQSTGTAHSWACSYSPKDDLADLVKSSIDPAMQEQISTALIGAPSLAQISADDLDDSQPDFLSGAATASQPDLSPQPLQAN